MKDSDRRMVHRRILELVGGVRWRWRSRIVLSGLTWIGAIFGAVLMLSALGLEQARFSATSVYWFRILTWGTFAVSTYWFLIRRLMVRVTDEQVGLYLEEHEPSLQHAVVTALEGLSLIHISEPTRPY